MTFPSAAPRLVSLRLARDCRLDKECLPTRCFHSSVMLSPMKSSSLVVVVLMVFFPDPVPAPLHASCNVDWTSGRKCSSVVDSLVKQIQAWSGRKNCPNRDNEKCLYTLGVNTTSMITARHETPTKGYVDDLKFDFTQDNTICKIHGYSTSRTWYAVLDYGTNYCNLFNLIQGIGLDKSANYTETTNDSICTQHSTANCDKY
ncbi:uncharacterized protein LOC121380768 [Gigantopelta aegis]|uniref:uncharacterized protein LOC121380768 n=1 Tax=Gigantopelta aegis TaxID=1735272 RepID=UPI001B888014|nr:uncharacterized protein LOC121380768 [Gigantopelta aegis]